ncbi:MAG TPA: SBBP repeat-containing protein, partial [Blastocatellia bacterium]|nr:SBBP repeat-containing protein [Blastocatellia bacterium]
STLSSPATFPLLNAFDSTRVSLEAYVAKLNANGTGLFYSSFLGGSGGDEGLGIVVDSADNTYVAGETGSATSFPQVNALPQILAGHCFLTKIEASLSRAAAPKILYSTTFGGSGAGASAIALDSDGNVYLTGRTNSGLPTTPGGFQTSFGGGTTDAFVAKLGSTFADTIGVFRPSGSQFLLRNSNTDGTADITANFGLAGDIPITGDWDGDGIDDVGVFRPSAGQFFLRQTTQLLVCVPPPCHTVTLVNTITVTFGQSGDLPVAGDWDGDGVDTVGVFRNGVFLLRESNSAGNPDFTTVNFGAAGDQPVAGDWDGDGRDTVGFFRPSAIQFQLTNTAQGSATPNFSFFFGLATDAPLAGDFNGDGVDTVGIFRDGLFFLSNSNSNPVIETTVQFGAAGDLPVIGDWDGKPPDD